MEATGMDRFRFRAWDRQINKMYYLNSLEEHHLLDCGFILMQCTGVKDSEGKLIWEGDVIESVDKFRFGDKAQVRWNGSAFINEPIGKPSHVIPIKKEKVIGNIYEHKHLLGGNE